MIVLIKIKVLSSLLSLTSPFHLCTFSLFTITKIDVRDYGHTSNVY